MCDYIFNQESNYFFNISPIFQLNNESSAWGYDFSNLELPQSEANLINGENGLNEEMEILEKIHEHEQNEIEIEKKEDFPNFNIIQTLNQQSLPIPQPEEKKDIKKKLQNVKEQEIAQKSTGDNTNNSKININKLIFGLQSEKKIEQRIDYAIKNIKVYISKYIKNYGNDLIKGCKFQNKLQKIKLFSPSYDYFTGNSNEKDNNVFLDFTVEQILTYPDKKNKKKKGDRLQRQNQENIKALKDYIEDNYEENVPEKMQELLNFFRMTYEEIVTLFYKSNKFIDYSSSEKTRKLDELFIKTKGFSLMENNGFIKLMKNYNKKNFKMK